MSRPLEQSTDTAAAVRSEVSGLGADLAPSKQEKDAVKGFITDVTRDVKSLVS